MTSIKQLFSALFSSAGLYVIALLAILTYSGYSIYKQVTLGDDPRDWKISCAGYPQGQTVLTASYMLKSMSVTKFTEDGKIIPCNNTTYADKEDEE